MKLKFKYRFAIFLINLIARTWQLKVKGTFPEKPAVVVFWHGLMLPGWLSFRGKNAKAIVSQSKDGEILSTLLGKWGFEVLRGSSSKGGKEILDSMTEHAKNDYVLITPDGPRGPAREMKAGAVVASMRSGTKLVLCSINIKSKFTFAKSWDKFEFPYPFSKIEIIFSDGIIIDKDLEREKVSAVIQEFEKKL